MLKTRPAVLTLCAAIVFTGCTTSNDVDATHLTIVTTESSLDHATALAVAEYVSDQDIAVTLEQHAEADEVFAALDTESDPAADHARIGVVTVNQEPSIEENPLRIPETIEVLSQAPAELGLVPATSTVTAAQFAMQHEADAEQPLAEACGGQTWFHAHPSEHEMEATTAALADLGCQPDFQAVDPYDSDGYTELAHRLTVEHDTVALLYGIDPVIPDEGLTTLDVVNDQWPHSNVVAVADPDLEDPLTEHIGAVLDGLDSEAATSLLRGYHNAQTSTSDLTYEIEQAIRYWLATQGLVDHDTVIDISTDNP